MLYPMMPKVNPKSNMWLSNLIQTQQVFQFCVLSAGQIFSDKNKSECFASLTIICPKTLKFIRNLKQEKMDQLSPMTLFYTEH